MLTRKLSWQVWSEHKYEDFPDRVVTFLKFLKTNWTFCVAILAPLVLIAIPANWEGHNGKVCLFPNFIRYFSTAYFPVTLLFLGTLRSVYNSADVNLLHDRMHPTSCYSIDAYTLLSIVRNCPNRYICYNFCL